jgi:hypothetical protein
LDATRLDPYLGLQNDDLGSIVEGASSREGAAPAGARDP